MDLDKIRKLRERIKNNKEKLKEETGNPKNQQILRLKIRIDEIQIQIENLK
jgi:predicted  nucleic acid-binding Zn-ribbon protein